MNAAQDPYVLKSGVTLTSRLFRVGEIVMHITAGSEDHRHEWGYNLNLMCRTYGRSYEPGQGGFKLPRWTL
jgi:hypothetical protein